MATIEETYKNWRATLEDPDDSLFYYHPNLERILLGFAIFFLSSKSLLQKLGKAESLKLLHIYIPDLITAWIDEDDKGFEVMFPLTIKVGEIYTRAAFAAFGFDLLFQTNQYGMDIPLAKLSQLMGWS